jgi:Trk-type K+ transport system membrane component
MSSETLIPWFAWLAPRLLLLFGIGFLVANIVVAIEVVRYHRSRRSALLVWPRPKPRYYAVSLLLGVILGLLIVVEILLKRPMYSLFGEAMMFIYYMCLFPLSTRIARGFYPNGVWSDSGFMPWSDISAVSWKDEGDVTLILISHTHSVARRLAVPGHRYGEARRVLRDRIQAHDIHMGGAGLNLGTRDDRDSV